jgi:hypothetical protein
MAEAKNSPQQGATAADVAIAKRRKAVRGASFVAAILIVGIGYTVLAGHPPGLAHAAVLTIPVLLVQTFVMAIYDVISESRSRGS